MNSLLRISILLIFQLFIGVTMLWSQSSNLRWKKIPVSSDTLTIDTLTIFQSSFKVFCGEEILSEDDYFFDGNSKQFLIKRDCSDSLQLRYRVFDFDFEKPVQAIDTLLIYREQGNIEDFYFHEEDNTFNFFSGDEIEKSGSISRGISFGNSQDLSVNSSLNLQLSGKISDNMNILATVTDNNLPIQPDGSTSQLQEFDQVFIQLYGKEYKIIAGDFWLKRPAGYFMNYNKRAQGLFGQYTFGKSDRQWTIQGGGALSKGKFSRNTIQGVEGNQGPYRLRGNENEPYIIVLSGTESVYIDGRLLKRGQDLDYTINYNTAELTFTPRNRITKDSRIVVEFQYSDQNYARSIFEGNAKYESDKFDFWINAYSEQDAKNQSLQQKLTSEEKFSLSQIGDSIELARINSIDSIGFLDNQVTYKLIDSLGIDSVLVHSVSPDSAFYRASFMNVGVGNGNYVFEKFTAVGRVYKWVAPVGGQAQGEFEPVRLMVTPKRKTMVSAGMEYRINNRWKTSTEFSISDNDINTFSKLDSYDNTGYANKTRVEGEFKLGRDSLSPWRLNTSLDFEITSKYFEEVERYRGIEFDRDWNVRGQEYFGNQALSQLGVRLIHQNHGSLEINGQNFTYGKDYMGNRANLIGVWNQSGFSARIDGSYLDSKTENHNSYLRHRASISQKLGPIKIGFEDDHERNMFQQGDSLLRLDSYQWYEWKAYISNADSLKNKFQVFYSERYDWKSDSTHLKNAATARDIGAQFDWLSNKNSILKTMASYRTLEIKNSDLINQTPENSFLGRIDYSLNLWKRALTANTFYEVGSGLEVKKEFLYIEVNAGQGVYTWVDYNGDGVKDLNEFEIAQYPDQANYVRIFTPTDDYVRTYSNEFNQTIFWRPERIWSNKKGALKFLSRISNQTRFRVFKKVSDPTADMYNPLSRDIVDTSLISLNSSIRNTIFFNRTNPIVGADYTFSQTSSKALLASGFDGRAQTFHAVSVRWNLLRKFTIKLNGEIGEKKSSADYTTGRDYTIAYHKINPEFIYQPNTVFRLSVLGRYEDKRNAKDLGGEKAFISDFGLRMKWNQLEKGSLNAEANMVMINYTGTQDNSLSYEMLESLKDGRNFTWGIGYQRNISKNLQVTIQYNGRKSEGNKVIHAGGVEVRAFF